MKKHYYTEVGLLILLSMAAATLAADQHFYELVWEYTGLDKNHIENSVAFIRIIGFGAIICLSISNIGKHLHSERRIVESLLASVHKVFFTNIDLTDSTSDTIYRITCHKYYSFSLFRTIVGSLIYILTIYFIGQSLSNKIESVSALWLWIITFFSVTLIFYIFLKVIDAWWYQFWLRIFKVRWKRNKWNRILRPGKNYCLSYVRYGYESGKLNRVNTTIPFLVNDSNRLSRLFTGKVYDSDNEIVISKDHNGINNLIRKFNEERKKDPDTYSADNDSFGTYLKSSVQVNISKLSELPSFKNSLTITEANRVTHFMESTYTLAYDLFDINNIRHCEHFLGFKIRGKGNSTWGVVVIDVLSNSDMNFYEYLGFQNDEEWLKIFLSSYSVLFSKAIIPNANE